MKSFFLLTFCFLLSFSTMEASRDFNFIDSEKGTQNPQTSIKAYETDALYEAVRNNDKNVESLLDECLKNIENHRKECMKSYKNGYFHLSLWQTPRMFADQIKKAFDETIRQNNLEIFKLFVEKDAYASDYALLQVAGLGKIEILQYLVQKAPKNLNNALLQAVQYNCLTDVQILIKATTDLTLPFIAACGIGYVDIVKVLIKNGAKNLNEGLEMAATGSQLNVIKYLINNGATNLKETLEEAEKWEDQSIINYLKKEIKKRTPSIKIENNNEVIQFPDSSTILIPSRNIVIHLKNNPHKLKQDGNNTNRPISLPITLATKKPPVKIGSRKFKEVKKRRDLKKEIIFNTKKEIVQSRPILIKPKDDTQKLKHNEHIVNQAISLSTAGSTKKPPVKIGTQKFKEVKYKRRGSKKKNN